MDTWACQRQTTCTPDKEITTFASRANTSQHDVYRFDGQTRLSTAVRLEARCGLEARINGKTRA